MRGPKEQGEMFDPSTLDVKAFTQLTNIEYQSVYEPEIEADYDESGDSRR